MKSKQSLIAALVGFAAIIAMPLAATAGERYVNNYENTRWQERGALIPVGHHYGWRNPAQYNSGQICDQDGDDCQPAVRCDADGDDCQPSTGYEGQYYGHQAPAYNRGYNPGYGRAYGAPAYNNYDYNQPAYRNNGYSQGYGSPYNAPYDNYGSYGGMSSLAPLLQQFVR